MEAHVSRVNFQRLIADLAEMYPFDVDEVIVSELIANSLDSGATRVEVDYSPDSRRLVVHDDGKGMSRSQFVAYHDFAAGLKTRGTGIGFAGVGAKISFNVADRVITKSRSDSFSGGSDWYMDSRGQLVWEYIDDSGLPRTGTRVEVVFRPDAQISFSSTNALISVIRRHYLPLIDPSFLELYDRMGRYSRSLAFIVNGEVVEQRRAEDAFGLDKVTIFFPTRRGHRIGYGLFGVAAQDYPMGSSLCGVILCSYGKVVKGDLFGQFPGVLGPRLFGLVEVPPLVSFLTTSKADFARHGRPREFEELYSPIREAFRDWLRKIGVETLETSAPDEARRLEREIQRLIEDVPVLGEFFGYAPASVKTAVFTPDDHGSTVTEVDEGVSVTFPAGDGDESDGSPGPTDRGESEGSSLVPSASGSVRSDPIGRKSRRGPKITFVEAPDRDELGWVEGGNVIINTGHPSYRRVKANNAARTVLNMFAIGHAVQRYLGDTERADPLFADRLMKAWGSK